ncbi:putative small RNA degrading nuclease 4 isoform X3 [Phoenix dactylifera]|uniref:Small RNA degrading nuclease 4 isoform X3 n=1 Tax=Phoenix dactylifera TaxID=42345 RepID=A0A8B7CCV5_PHODC|nr:putative small RNA degrading nuclease 4 isoform X3 [Phoenix dactylifera]
MEEPILNADREVLAEIVRLSQKQGLKGREGGWKDFLHSNSLSYGAVYDPMRKSKDILVAFLQTFQEKDQKFFRKMIRRITEYKAFEKFISDFPGQESPQQRLVRLTMEHPHYPRFYSFPSHDEEWMFMPLGKVSEVMKSKTMISIDCEMVLCEDGTEAVVQVCAVDENLEVKLDKLVNPNKAVADYITDITGISAKDLEGVTCSLADVQSVLGFALRAEGEPHNCLNDAKAAMKLVLAKLEHGFDDPISVVDDNLSDSDQAKLLLHKIPVDVPYQELLKLFPENYNVDIKNDLKVRGPSYSTFAVFKDAREADEAFKGIEASESRDSNGRPQKNVFLEISTGKSISFYVRRMRAAAPANGCDPLNKRTAQDETNDSKRQRTCLHHCKHVEDIEKLKQELRQREEEIFELQKIVSALARKKGISCISTNYL